MALAFGEWDVDRFLEKIPSEILTKWMAFYSLEPWGFRAKWQHTASILAMIANVNRKKGKRAFRVEDFMPKDWKLPSPKQTVEVLKTKLLAAFGFGKKKKKGRENEK